MEALIDGYEVRGTPHDIFLLLTYKKTVSKPAKKAGRPKGSKNGSKHK